MELSQYRTFTQALYNNLQADENVIGLVALGSMAETSRLPDTWSDHDFFVITKPDHQEDYRRDLSWLPHYERIVLQFRETAHGLKVIYDDGHLLEFAIFDAEELFLAQVNDYRVLIDRADIEADMATIRATSTKHSQNINVKRAFAMFIAQILVGAGRIGRGENLSGHLFIKSYALEHLLQVLVAHLPENAQRDNLNASRRFSAAYPELGRRLQQALLQEPLECARTLLNIADDVLANTMPNYPHEAVKVVCDYVSNAAQS